MMNLERYATLIQHLLSTFKTSTAPDDNRAVYQPLKVYSQLLKGIPAPELRDSIPKLDNSIWSMLTLQVAGEAFNQPLWLQRAKDAFNNLADHQQPTGEFLAPDSKMNLESRWYEELTTLHAAASYAARVPSQKINSAVRRNAEYHLQETQPDHATSEPWGLLAFIQYAPSLADQILHAMQMQYPNAIPTIPLLLLQDVRYGLQRLTDNGPEHDQ
jgi:hypothetical protein